MDQLVNVILAIDKVHTALQRVLDCRPGLGGLKQVMGPTIPLPLGDITDNRKLLLMKQIIFNLNIVAHEFVQILLSLPVQLTQ